MARRHGSTRHGRWVTGLCLVASLLTLRPASAGADEASQRREATELADRGQESLERGDVEGALALFRRASQTLPSPAILLFEARCLVKLGRLLEASETYRRAETFALPPTAGGGAREALTVARDEGAQVRARLARLTVIIAGDQSPPSGLTLRLDGQAAISPGVERAVDP
ncbi:MAG: tetratricopeptide repeat protein, partial [Myxococcales bacterium]